MSVETFYSHADSYDEWFDRHAQAYLSELKAVREFLPEKGFGIEIGVGTGRFAGPLKIALGVDIPWDMLLRARERGINAIMANGEELPFQDGIFDFALIVTVLCFTKEPPRIVREAARVLKKGGRLITGIIDRNSFLGKKYTARKSRSRFYRRARFLSPEEVIAVLNKNGLSKIESCQCIFNDPSSITEAEVVEKGWGRGGFIVISAGKK